MDNFNRKRISCEKILIANIITGFNNHMLIDIIHVGMFDSVHYVI